jgi:hypothetical protein
MDTLYDLIKNAAINGIISTDDVSSLGDVLTELAARLKEERSAP